jgi:hypothetical protein
MRARTGSAHGEELANSYSARFAFRLDFLRCHYSHESGTRVSPIQGSEQVRPGKKSQRENPRFASQKLHDHTSRWAEVIAYEARTLPS